MTRRPTYDELGRKVKELERKLGESEREKETLPWSEHNFRNVIESAQEGILIIQNTRIIFANTRACEFLGRSEEELSGCAFIDFVHPDDQAWLIDQYLKKLAGEDVPLGQTYRVLGGEGRTRWVQSRSAQVEWSNRPALLSFLIDVTDMKVAEERLRESEEKYRRLIENTKDVIYSLDTEGRFIYVSPSVQILTGYTSGEVTGRSFMEFIHPDDLPFIMERFKGVLGGKTLGSDYRIVDKSRNIRWVYSSTSPTIENNRVVALQGILTDISERKQAEEAFRDSEKKYRNLVEESFDGIFIQRGPNIIFANKRLNEMLGYEDGELIGRNHWLLYHPDYQKLTRERARARMRGEEVVNRYEVKLQRKDGAWFFGEINTRAITFPADEQRGIQVWVKDIDERKRAEKALRESEEMLKSIFENKGTATGIFGEDGIIRKCNAVFEKLSGYSKSEIIGEMKWSDFLVKEDLKRLQKYHAQRLKGENPPPSQYECGIMNRKGEIRTVIVNISVVGDDRIVSLTDITARKKSEEERQRLERRLQQAQNLESIGNLAGGIAHDFNNILFPILGFSELLLDDLSSNSAECDMIRHIINAAKRGRNLVQQILAFSRLSEHKMVPLQIQRVLKEALNLFRSTIPANIEIFQNIHSDCGMIMGDPTQIHRVAMNLITNAYHAVEETGGSISVHLREETFHTDSSISIKPGSYVHLTISDTGCGIDPKHIQKIFEPYFTTKEQGKGTGLGLAVVHGIVKEHGGDIRVSSELDKGSTFHLYFPLLEKPAKTESIPTSATHSTGTETILVVDDESAIVLLEKQALERLHYKVEGFTNSGDALKRFKADPNRFDLVMTDMAMPKMTGEELAGELVSIRPDIPIILCTGFSERINKQSRDKLPIKGLLEKPISKSEMARMVREILDGTKDSA